MSPCLARGCLRTLSNGLLLPPALPDRLFTYNTAKPLLASSIPARLAHAIARATSPIRAHRKWAARRLPSLILLRVFETESKGRGAGMPALRERRVWRMCRCTLDCRPRRPAYGMVRSMRLTRRERWSKRLATRDSPNGIQNAPGTAAPTPASWSGPVTGRRPTPANLDHTDYSHRYPCTVARLNTIRGSQQSLGLCTWPLPRRVLMNHLQRDNEVRVSHCRSALSPTVQPRHY